jgi:hypothetical protein
LGNPHEEDEKIYMELVLKRVLNLVQALHQNKDEIFIVCHFDRLKRELYKKLNVFNPFMRNKNVKYKMLHQVFLFRGPEEYEEDEWETHRLLLKCEVQDINLSKIIRTFFNRDDMPRLYFINIKRETIFSIYDDRGCNLVSTKKENIEEIYHTFNDWILDWDRSRIDQLFKLFFS